MARHSDGDGSGFGFGLRASSAFPFGGFTADRDLKGPVAAQQPIWLEAGYHINGNIYAGAYFQWAPSLFGRTNCLGGADCSSSGMRFGIEGIYKFMPNSVVQPWAGLGVGYELLNLSQGGADSTYKGLELLTVQAGIDFGTQKIAIGPFVSYALFGKFTSFDASGYSNDIGNSAGHSWLQVGIKAGFKL